MRVRNCFAPHCDEISFLALVSPALAHYLPKGRRGLLNDQILEFNLGTIAYLRSAAEKCVDGSGSRSTNPTRETPRIASACQCQYTLSTNPIRASW